MSYMPSSQNSKNFEINSSIELDLLYSTSIFSSKSKKCQNDSKQDSPLAPQNIISSCCICSGQHMLAKCEQKDCSNQMHLSCLTYFFPELTSPIKSCPTHSFKHLDEISKLLHLSSHLNSSDLIETFIKSRENYKKELELSGKLFWFCLNYQYFPYINIENLKSSNSTQAVPSSSQDGSWLSSQLKSIERTLSNVQSSINSLKRSINANPKTYSKNPKPGENLINSHRLPMNQYGKLVRNYEKSMIRSFTFTPRDYQNFQSEDKIVCAVCDSGESVDENLIVICSSCSLPVHSECYRIRRIPEDDWLCDPCSAQLASQQCCLCPVRGGALKSASFGLWVHVTCGRYLQNSFLPDSTFDIGKIEQNKFKLRCFSCGLKVGACVQCSCGRCANAFHIECRKDLIEFGPAGLLWFCPSHKASRLTRLVKAKLDFSLEYVRQAAVFVWSQNFKQNETKKRKYVKKSIQGNEKKKLVVQVCGNYVLVKSFVGNKLVNILKFVEDKARGACEGFEKLETCLGMNCKVEEENKKVLITSEKNDVEVSIQMPKINYGMKLKKKRKICG